MLSTDQSNLAILTCSPARKFATLIDADDRLLASRHVTNLIFYIGNRDPGTIEPVIRRMLSSAYPVVREWGGFIGAYAGLELGNLALETSVESLDPAVRTGAARLLAGRLTTTTEPARAAEALRRLVDDEDHDVRKAAAEVVAALRGQPLRPHAGLLEALIASMTLVEAQSQLLITLERAPDRVDDFILTTAQRFVDVHGPNIANIATGASAEARELAELILRAYAQAARLDHRRDALDLLDRLLLLGAHGVEDLVSTAER